MLQRNAATEDRADALRDIARFNAQQPILLDAAREREVAARDLAIAHAQIDRLTIELETIRQREAAAIERANAAAQRQWLSSQQTLLTTALRDREAAAAELAKVNQQKNA